MRETPKMSGFKYVSCIKIKGQPILPPIITAKDRLELLKDKEKAVMKEKEIAMRSSSSATSEVSDETDESFETERLMEFIRNALPQEKLKNIEEVKMLQDAILTELKKYNDVEDDTLHNVDDISPIDGRSLSDISPLKSPEYARLSVPDEFLNVKSTESTSRIRRNSYTLESPSTSVLAYLKSLTESDKSEKKVVRNLNNCYDGRRTPSPSKNIIRLEQKRAILENNNITYNMEIAATKIQAGIRGYLTRRLMKTYKVMELKNTIKDSLITALQLHSEPAVNKAELDLHKRLALQVEKVCEEWHHIFFELSPKERMRIIQIDRNRSLLAKKPKYQNKSRPKTKSESLMSTSTPASFAIKRRSHKSVQTDSTPMRPSSLPLSRSTTGNFKPWR